ncbi:MAG: DUF3487 family protein [Gammaproteobacteria bacterium]|nr:DUF3487 family protein [Gammaproteobacteria bacterium]
MAELDLLVNRLNFDPVIFKGCSERELYFTIIGVSLPICAIFGLFGYLAWSNIFYGILIGAVLSLAVVFFALGIVEKIKRDKEPGYVQQLITFKLEQKGFIKTPIIRRSGIWMIGRYL